MAESDLDSSGEGPSGTGVQPATAVTAGSPGRGSARPRDFGWRQGLLLGAVVLVVVYAIAGLTAVLPLLRNGLEHLPVAIAVLVAGTLAVLIGVFRSVRRG